MLVIRGPWIPGCAVGHLAGVLSTAPIQEEPSTLLTSDDVLAVPDAARTLAHRWRLGAGDHLARLPTELRAPVRQLAARLPNGGAAQVVSVALVEPAKTRNHR